MKDTHPKQDRPGAERQDRAQEAQPWHPADEKPKSPKAARGGAPIGTHSLTGAASDVGLPESPKAGQSAERSRARDKPGAEEPDPLLEPRSNIADILGRKP